MIKLAGEAVDKVRREQYNQHGRSASGEGKWIKGTRYSLLKDTAKQTPKQLLKLAEVVLTNKPLYRAFLLYRELRYIYRLPYHEAVERLLAWLAWASRSRLKPFVKLKLPPRPSSGDQAEGAFIRLGTVGLAHHRAVDVALYIRAGDELAEAARAVRVDDRGP